MSPRIARAVEQVPYEAPARVEHSQADESWMAQGIGNVRHRIERVWGAQLQAEISSRGICGWYPRGVARNLDGVKISASPALSGVNVLPTG
jgi:hypothetical protein